MSIFDEDEQLERVDDTVILKQFLKTYVAPELDKLSKECSIHQYALGIYVPEDFPYDMVQSIKKDCNIKNISHCVVPMDSILRRNDLAQFYITLLQKDYSVVIVENFDKVPDGVEKEYIENLLLAPFTDGNKVPCDRYFVIFITHSDYGNSTPPMLEKISGLKWLGNINGVIKQ